MPTDMLSAARRPAAGFDLEAVRADFPILGARVYGEPLVYLDNAATSQKPRRVIERIRQYYEAENSNIHRGVHYLSARATDAYDAARHTLARFINAPAAAEVLFTRGATEGINLVAASFLRPRLRAGDEVVITAMEHHSNIVPWQLVCAERGAALRVAPIDARGVLDVDALEALLTERTRLVALCHISNALGTVNPVAEVVRRAHARGVPVLVDGAQGAPHGPLDVQALGCDFYAFSGHKMFGPTGIGVLWGREALLDEMPPYQGGGDMIEAVTFERATFNTLPHKFEAGTPHVEGALGLEAAARYLEDLGREAAARYERDLLGYATALLRRLPGLRIVGEAPEKAGVLSFVLDGVHPYDAGALLDRMGIAIRTGHHCTQPLMDALGLPGTIRASFAFYNTPDEAERLAAGVERVQSMLG